MTGWRLGETVVSSLPTLSAERRAEILALPRRTQTHDVLLHEMPFRDAVEVRPPPEPASSCDGPARMVAWNAERCTLGPTSARMLERTGAQAFLLSELDWGMSRSGQRHTARDLARELGCGYVFAVEFLELGLGNEEERTRHAGQTNDVGYHGAAILSPHPLDRPAVVRIEGDGGWFDGERGERRVGGRIAVLATLRVAGVAVALASVHLESHTGPEDRCEQLRRLLEALEVYAPGAPVLIGGDLNTHTLGPEHRRDPDRLERALHTDPDRLRRPAPYEPLFDLAESAGYEWRRCNRVSTSTQRIPHPAPSSRGALKLDWFLCRSLHTRQPEVVAAVDPASGRALSDHEAIAVTIEPG